MTEWPPFDDFGLVPPGDSASTLAERQQWMMEDSPFQRKTASLWPGSECFFKALQVGPSGRSETFIGRAKIIAALALQPRVRVLDVGSGIEVFYDRRYSHGTHGNLAPLVDERVLCATPFRYSSIPVGDIRI